MTTEVIKKFNSIKTRHEGIDPHAAVNDELSAVGEMHAKLTIRAMLEEWELVEEWMQGKDTKIKIEQLISDRKYELMKFS